MIEIRRSSIKSFPSKNKIESKVLDKKSDKTEATIYLYGEIGGYFGIDAQEWITEFNTIDADTIHIRINSNGGDLFMARAMKTAIMQSKAKTIAHIDGLAASAASFFALGANEVEIVDGGFIMVHKALSFIDIFGYFNEDHFDQLINELQKEKDLHAKINDTIAKDYAKQTGKTVEEAIVWMTEETWFTAEESKELGLVDRIYDGEPVDGHFDLEIFANAPQELVNRTIVNVKKTAERAMRDAGIPAKLAKEIISKGYKTNQRDVGSSDTSDIDNKIEEIDGQRDVVDSSDIETPTDPFLELLAKADNVLNK